MHSHLMEYIPVFSNCPSIDIGVETGGRIDIMKVGISHKYMRSADSDADQLSDGLAKELSWSNACSLI